MTIPHTATLYALERARKLIMDHRYELAPAQFIVGPTGGIKVQITAADTFDEPTRRASVDLVADALNLPKPAAAAGDLYSAHSADYKLSVYTAVRSAKCSACGRAS